MKVVAYSIRSSEKEPLAIANRKKHDITLISNALSEETVVYAFGKEAVIVVGEDLVSAKVIDLLADLGVKYIATRSTLTDHIDRKAAERRHIRVANVPISILNTGSDKELPMALATQTILNLDKWQTKKCLGKACVCSKSCDQIK